MLLPNILAVATSTVARFTVLLNPAAGWVAATKLSLTPPRIPLAPEPNKSVNLDRLLKLGRPAVKLPRLGKPVVKLFRLGKPAVKLFRLGRPEVSPLRLGKFTPPRLLKLVNGLVALVANCEALPRVSMAVRTLGKPGTTPSINVPRLGIPGNLEVSAPIDGKLDVSELIDGMLLAHCAVSSVPNLPALPTNAPTPSFTVL